LDGVAQRAFHERHVVETAGAPQIDDQVRSGALEAVAGDEVVGRPVVAGAPLAMARPASRCGKLNNGILRHRGTLLEQTLTVKLTCRPRRQHVTSAGT